MRRLTPSLRLRPALLALLFWLAAGPGPAESGLHPQDGPDVDLRLRIDDRALTVNTVVNLAFLDAVSELVREDEDALHELEYEDAEAVLREHLQKTCRVTIDGVTVTPVMEEFAVDPGDIASLPLFPVFGMRAIIKVRLQLRYPAKSRPEKLSMTWGSYPPTPAFEGQEEPPPLEVRAQLLVNGRESYVDFKEEAPTWDWTASEADRSDRFLPLPEVTTHQGLELPLASFVLVGLGALGLVLFARGRPLFVWLLIVVVLLVGAWALRDVAPVSSPAWMGSAVRPPSPDECRAIFRPLHANIYRAFDYTDRSDVYDALARSVDGELLDRLYDQVHRGLVLQEEGGAVCRVQRVTPIEVDVEGTRAEAEAGSEFAAGFTIKSRWQVYGTVFHWGHRHGRTNEYLARYEVARQGDTWRIIDTKMLEQRRVSSEVLDEEEGR